MITLPLTIHYCNLMHLLLLKQTSPLIEILGLHDLMVVIAMQSGKVVPAVRIGNLTIWLLLLLKGWWLIGGCS
jgi:hypothetical protein